MTASACPALVELWEQTSETKSEKSTRSSQATPSVSVDTLMERALAAAPEGRNDAGFGLACQLRDNGYRQADADAVMADYQRRVGQPPDDPYTLAEAQASVIQAYKRERREPWGSASDQ